MGAFTIYIDNPHTDELLETSISPAVRVEIDAYVGTVILVDTHKPKIRPDADRLIGEYDDGDLVITSRDRRLSVSTRDGDRLVPDLAPPLFLGINKEGTQVLVFK